MGEWFKEADARGRGQDQALQKPGGVRFHATFLSWLPGQENNYNNLRTEFLKSSFAEDGRW